MNEKYSISQKLKYITFIFIALGIFTVIFGLYFETQRTWANILLNNYYFISIAIGASFFYAIQYITQSGWSAIFQKIPLAISSYLTISVVLTLLLIFGIHYLYKWSLPNAGLNDAIIQHKIPYLNTTFFFIRILLFFGLWIFMTQLLLRTSINEDKLGGLKYFYKSEFYSKIYIFILAFTFSIFTFDLIMSIDVHWFSTIFAVKNFVFGFYHAISIIVLIIILLNHNGYFKALTKSHLYNYSKYLFILSLIWMYLWFMEYLLVWFGNIQEETIYFIFRTQGKWKILFFLNIIINWAIPFFVLMPSQSKQSKSVLLFICLLLIIGQWVDLFLQIMPGTMGVISIGFIEIGIFIGFVGVFTLIVLLALSKSPLIPKNHPFLEESINN